MGSAFKGAGVNFAELWAPHVETAEEIGATGVPRAERRELVRKWRLSVPMDKFVAIKKSFDDAGVTLTSYDIEYRDDWTDEEIARLHVAARESLAEWTARLRAETRDGFPERVTAFRPEMAVHGKYRQPCPVCGAPVQRIRYADNETNYCPGCQTGGKIFADRSLSRLLKDDWPGHLDELE